MSTAHACLPWLCAGAEPQLLEVLRGLMEGRAALKAEVEQKGKYQRFLDSVCEDSSEYFESIENITMRYETLAAAHFDLRSRASTRRSTSRRTRRSCWSAI